MVDISMCSGKNCPLKEKCYRFKAKPNKFMQSYFTIPPIKEDGTCEHFWEMSDNINKNSCI